MGSGICSLLTITGLRGWMGTGGGGICCDVLLECEVASVFEDVLAGWGLAARGEEGRLLISGAIVFDLKLLPMFVLFAGDCDFLRIVC